MIHDKIDLSPTDGAGETKGEMMLTMEEWMNACRCGAEDEGHECICDDGPMDDEWIAAAYERQAGNREVPREEWDLR